MNIHLCNLHFHLIEYRYQYQVYLIYRGKLSRYITHFKSLKFVLNAVFV